MVLLNNINSGTQPRTIKIVVVKPKVFSKTPMMIAHAEYVLMYTHAELEVIVGI